MDVSRSTLRPSSRAYTECQVSHFTSMPFRDSIRPHWRRDAIYSKREKERKGKDEENYNGEIIIKKTHPACNPSCIPHGNRVHS